MQHINIIDQKYFGIQSRLKFFVVVIVVFEGGENEGWGLLDKSFLISVNWKTLARKHSMDNKIKIDERDDEGRGIKWFFCVGGV